MIIYSSRTGNVRYITTKLESIDCLDIKDIETVDSNFIIFTYTDGLGNIPKAVDEFMINNYQNCKGVIASGNSNFGVNVFCASADKINEKYGIPVIHKIELRGFEKDYKFIKEQYDLIMRKG
ncbi:class Ib ribonucleoside-diphosphate reductase assembly flavoprotein NrdI [Lysinibacillus sp. NPDC093712]|uniref:class Ib ribonucleoside-diphosphate reductase assembly flavoprotein NrdI n=1 Tax=Lysinibacillus sp. NPDC093712 TaxID=3390579 RepID=UPI003D07733A